MKLSLARLACPLLLGVLAPAQAWAQGQDSTPSERDIMILREILPGEYNNGNQAYFDTRRKLPDAQRHPQTHLSVTPIEASELGGDVFLATETPSGDDAQPRHSLYSFTTDNAAGAVRMKTYQLRSAPEAGFTGGEAAYAEGCDLLWRLQMGQYRATLESKGCELGPDAQAASEMVFSDRGLLINRSGVDGDDNAFLRARDFSCYIDVPGVGGGVDVPYKRFEIPSLHDLGGEEWITTDQGEEIGLRLFRVYWPINNYEGLFTRPSFVIYLMQKDENGKPFTDGYSFTGQDVERLGINLKWALASCAMLPITDVTPYLAHEPRAER